MRITGIRCRRFTMHLKKPIKVASGEITSGDTVLVRLDTDTGLYGLGEGSGVPFVTGEDCGDVLAGSEKLAEAALGRSPFEIQAVHAAMDAIYTHHTAAKAAIDIALFDLMAKAAGLPLYRFLGGTNPLVETDKTITLASPREMAAEAAELAARGFRYIKIKAGEDPEADIEAVRLIREAVGPGVHLKLDANQGWTVPAARRVMDALGPCRIDALEQPLPSWDLQGMSSLRGALDVPVMADESCFSPTDAMDIVRRGAADLINIKLMKSGGIHPARQISAVAASAGVRCMLGCMTESRIGTAAAASLAAADPNILWADLDSTMFFDENDGIRGGCTVTGPHILLGEEPGLGAEADF